MQKNIRILRMLLVLAFIPGTILAQEKYTISGSITDDDTGEDLFGASVYVAGTSFGATTNVYGFYSLTIPEGTYEITTSYVGFEDIVLKLTLNQDISKNVKLIPSGTMLQEVEVSSVRSDNNVSSSEMSVERIDIKQLETIPVLLGEKDVLKTIQLMPGISTASEGSSGFSVRGGSTDQNLILLDGAPVYSASHLMGFFSVFNSDALKNMSVYKGGIPANYGGRASSVVDIGMKDGNNKHFAASGGIGLISSRLAIEGPIVKDKASFIVSGRRSYADIVAKGINVLDSDASLYFYDLNAKVNYKLNDKNRLFLSGYFGQDSFGFGDMGMGWGNTTGTLRYNHLFSSKLFSNTTLLYSNYNYGFNIGSDASMSSGIEDFSFKQDFTYFLNPKNKIKTGFISTYHIFNPGELTMEGIADIEIILDKKQALESAVYVSNEHNISNRISAEYGIRLSMFNQLGEGWSKSYNDNNIVVDSTYFASGDIMQTYINYEPRASVMFRLDSNSSVKASYNRMAQYLHLLSNSTSGQPTDTWMPSSVNLKPQVVNQVALGYFRNFDDNRYEFSVETYYKSMTNVADYEDGTDVMLNENIEASVLSGIGRSYGLEFYLKKKYGRLNGWISYTLARTENQIDGINNDLWYASKLDKTHDFSIVLSYQFTERLSLSTAWIYYTGNAVTFPSGRYEFDGNIIPYYTERNGYRMPDYHRLDLNLHLDGKKKKRFNSSWDFSLYNVYNRHNAYTISFQESESVSGNTEAVQLSLFGIVPSVTWNFKF